MEQIRRAERISEHAMYRIVGGSLEEFSKRTSLALSFSLSQGLRFWVLPSNGDDILD